MIRSGAPSSPPWKPLDLRDRDGRAEVGVLPRALDDPAPPWIAGDVDHRRERPVDADGARLAGGHRLAPLDGLRVPGGRHGDRHRQDRAEPVDDVEAEQQRDAEAIAFDRQPLQAVGLGRIGDEQQGPAPPCLQRRLDRLRLLVGVEVERRLGTWWQSEVEVLGELPGLLGRRHLADQLIHLRLDRVHLVLPWLQPSADAIRQNEPWRYVGSVESEEMLHATDPDHAPQCGRCQNVKWSARVDVSLCQFAQHGQTLGVDEADARGIDIDVLVGGQRVERSAQRWGSGRVHIATHHHDSYAVNVIPVNPQTIVDQCHCHSVLRRAAVRTPTVTS